MPTHHVFLIPGFFGFVNFGRLVYFTHVREFLEDAFAKQRLEVEVHRVRLKPTSSLRVRATELAKAVAEMAPGDAPIHLIGHSTGGLDARLFVTPGVTLDDLAVEPIASRVQSVVTVATPHRGTPLAEFFSSHMGAHALRLLSLATITILRNGRIPVALMARVTGTMLRLAVGKTEPGALLDHLEDEMLGTLPDDQRDLIGGFVRDVSGDQALIPQLTPAAMDVFDAATSDRPHVRYASVVACAAAPSLRTRLGLGPRPWKQATYALYSWLHHRVGDGDGIVPVESQRRGKVLYEARGDHLDVIGHFHGPDHQPPHTDWLNTGSKFDRTHFEELWTSVARFIARA